MILDRSSKLLVFNLLILKEQLFLLTSGTDVTDVGFPAAMMLNKWRCLFKSEGYSPLEWQFDEVLLTFYQPVRVDAIVRLYFWFFLTFYDEKKHNTKYLNIIAVV